MRPSEIQRRAGMLIIDDPEHLPSGITEEGLRRLHVEFDKTGLQPGQRFIYAGTDEYEIVSVNPPKVRRIEPEAEATQ